MQVKAAMIMMAIMGCNDSGTKCVQLAATEPKWSSVAECDKASEKALEAYTKANYPTVIAICQSPQVAQGAPASGQGSASRQQPGATEARPAPKPTIAQKTIQLVEKAIPTTDDIKSAFFKPVHVISDSYSWVVRKFKRN